MNEPMDILVTVDENYLKPLKVMLFSMYEHHKNQQLTIWLIHKRIPTAKLVELENFITDFNWQLKEIKVEPNFFKDAPTVERYPEEMYFRLLCGDIMPKTINRVLYLDPDILVINSLNKLWQTDIENHLLAAATHTGVTNITTSINHIRLNTNHNYYNSGVMLINLDKAREFIFMKDIKATIEKYGNQLLLPDQDILNHLYGAYVKEVPEEIWNYDARKYKSYLAKSLGEYDTHWIMRETSILHFCGKPKPWQEKSDTRFTALYLDYMNRLDML